MLITEPKSVVECYFDYWQHKGHDYSECLYNQEIKNIFVNIPKNASTNIKFAISNQGFYGTNLFQSKELPIYQSLVIVLRDPVDRWVSGITTYLNHHIAIKDSVSEFVQSLKNGKEKWLIEILFDKVTFDDHTEKQTYFIKPFDLSNVYFFDAQNYEMLEYKIKQFYLGEGVNLDFDHDYKNSRKQDPIHQFFTEFLFDSKNSKYKQRLVDYYIDDYKFINSIKFYGSR